MSGPEQAATVTPGQAAYKVDLRDLADATELLREGNELRSQLAAVVDERDRLTERVAELVTEGNEMRRLIAEILGRFHYLHQDFMECDTTPDEFAKWSERAGLNDPPAVVTAGTEHLAEKIRGLAIGAEES